MTAGIAYCQDSGNSTCEALFRDEFWYLYEEHDYRNNVLNGLMTSPEERNYSDDEQYFQAILPFFIYCDQVWGENLDVIDTFKTGIEQVWKYAKKDGSSAWQGRNSLDENPIFNPGQPKKFSKKPKTPQNLKDFSFFYEFQPCQN